MADNIGIVLLVIFSVACLAVFVQIVAAIIWRRKILRLIDEGYYFIEVQVRWRRKELRPIHPSNVDFSSGVLRLATPISTAVY
ncbi:hypothetical protein NQ318_000208 [Aromia moschata]|uniref:Uncharacterized protein n=1 Tax=Aromia moschata TaxID=1265417 RepID=A0AAV8YKJ7_9CUCU|nr:hypothetical protein NQ318_000208 [Aromia moschata]